MPVRDLLHALEAVPAGLSSVEASERLRRHGPNSLAKESRFASLTGFLRVVATSVIPVVAGDPIGGSSSIVNFHVEFQARHATEDIDTQVPPPPFCAMTARWSRRWPNWCPATSSGSMRETWRRPMRAWRTPGIYGCGNRRSPASCARGGGTSRPPLTGVPRAVETCQKLSADGFRTLGVAVRTVEQQGAYAFPAEQEMTLVGSAAFLDPAREGIAAVLQALKGNSVAHDVGCPPTALSPMTRWTTWTMPPRPFRPSTAPFSLASLRSRRIDRRGGRLDQRRRGAGRALRLQGDGDGQPDARMAAVVEVVAIVLVNVHIIGLIPVLVPGFRPGID